MNQTHSSAAAPPSDLLSIRAGASRLLRGADPVPAGWSVRGLRRLDPRTVLLRIGPADGQVVALEWIDHGGDEVDSFVAGEAFAVSYRRAPGAWDLDDPETPVAIKRAAAAACQALALAARIVSLSGAGAAPSTPADEREIELAPEPFEAWLAGRLAVGADLADGWCLSEVYAHGLDELAVSFVRGADEPAARLKVRLRDDERQAATRTRSLDLTYTLVFGEATESSRADVHARLAAELGLVLDALDRGVRFVAQAARQSEPERGVGHGPPPAMNLAIPAPCGLQCTFCSVREEIYPILDAQSAFVRALARDVERAGARGTRVLRINGIEPLNAPYLFDLLALARRSGFEEFHLHSTCRPLADPEFAARFVAAMPDSYRIYVPIYGSTAARHDGVSGAPGSFEEVLRAVSNLRGLMDERGTLLFTTVVVRQLLDDLAAIRDLVKPLGRWWEVHLPFPNTSSKTDRYRDVSVRMTDALERIYPEGWWPLADLPLGEILPCVALAHQRRTGHELVSARRISERMREPAGTFYRSAGFEHSMGGERATAFVAATTACPHRDGCALRTACPGEVYGLYAEQHGLDELGAVSREDLLALPDGEEILVALR